MIDQTTISSFIGNLRFHSYALEEKVALLKAESKRKIPNPWRVMQAEKEVREQLDKMMSVTSGLWKEIYETEPKEYRDDFGISEE